MNTVTGTLPSGCPMFPLMHLLPISVKALKHFDRKEISAEDVTEEYVDVEARLKAKRLLEKRYLELLNKATKVSEMLEIEREFLVQYTGRNRS